MDYIEDWDSLPRDVYLNKKKEAGINILQRLEKVIPGIKDCIEDYEVGTSKTIQRYTLNPGTAYGYAQIPEQAIIKRIQQKSPVENLWFAGAWTMPGGGFSAAIGSGYSCAKEILKK